MSNEIPIVRPVKLKQYEVKQSKYNVVSQLPIRAIVLGPSGSGKSILIQNMILDIYKDCFSRIYIFSPSIDVDFQTWQPVKDWINKNISNNDEEQFYFNNFDEEALSNIISTQKKIIEYQKKHEHKKLFSILIVIDDYADNFKVSHHPSIKGLFTKSRHSQISVIVGSQKFRALSNIIRVNASDLYVFKLRNYSDLQAFLDEVAAIAPKDVILEMYNLAVEEPYSFLTVKLTAKEKKNKQFLIRFDKALTFN